jgi:hypothetical protein
MKMICRRHGIVDREYAINYDPQEFSSLNFQRVLIPFLVGLRFRQRAMAQAGQGKSHNMFDQLGLERGIIWPTGHPAYPFPGNLKM